MPSFLKYGSTGRPPGKLHLRHSLKDFTYNLEFSHPPFDILSIEIANNNNNNNNNNNISYIDNGGNAVPADAPDDTGLPVGLPEWFTFTFTDQIESINCSYKFNKLNKYKLNSDGLNIDGISSTTTATTATPATTINYKTRAEGISTEDGEAGLSVWSTDRIESNQFNSGNDQIESNRYNYKYKYKYKFNIDGISTTTTTPATATINYKTSAEGISNEGGEEAAAGLSERLADRLESNQCNYKYKYKFNIEGISTTTTTAATPAPTTINYKTSAEGISNEDGEAGSLEGSTERIESNRIESNQSEWSTNLFESNRCNSISNNNNNSNTGSTNKDNCNKTFHHFFLFKLISLYLIITKSFISKQFTKEPKEKQHHHQQQQQHYHSKRRHQFHLEQQQKHQHFKQEQHNMERMVTSIVLKLSLVAWDMWAFRNVF